MMDYKDINYVGKESSVDTWPLMNSPGPIIFIVSIYLIFVTKIGPKIMEKRDALELKKLLIAYNAFLVFFNIWLTSKASDIDISMLIHSRGCTLKSYEVKDGFADKTLSKVAWWYFISKVIELLDTVFFILRKKNDQLSFLHIYHHSMTAVFAWCYLRLIPGEQGFMIGFLNSIVHSVMYTYYLLAAMGPEYKKYLWWKKYMTVIQLVQFLIMMSYLVLTIVMDCGVPKILTYCFMVHVVIFLYLFGKFYTKSYTKKKKV